VTANWFIGIPVPAARWLPAALAQAPPCLRPFHPDDVHITVAFLGPTGDRRALAAWDALASCPERGPFSVTLGPLEPFGGRTPSAYSFVLDSGRAEVSDYVAAVRDRALSAADARPDTRPPKPHLTIARPPRKASTSERREAAAWARRVVPPAEALQLDRIALFTWADDRRARQFQIVREVRWADAP
jgi:2'-5' RNA ligase